MITAEGLRKTLAGREVLRGVDLTVPAGTVTALLGPNGAGKTTTIRVLSTLTEADGGSAQIDGIDVQTDPAAVRRRLGLTGQFAALDDRLTGRENLELIGRLQRLGRQRARTESQRLLHRFGLEDAGDRLVRDYSGGMRRRVDIAASLISAPKVLFLDEPTTGLDPSSRLQLWELIREEVANGLTVLLTTQYLEEADQLAQDVVVIDDGKVVEHGTPTQLKDRFSPAVLHLTFDDPAEALRAQLLLRSTYGASPETSGTTLTMPLGPGVTDLTHALQSLESHSIPVARVRVQEPSLDDVFLNLTERAAS